MARSLILIHDRPLIENASYLKKLPIPELVFVAQNAVSATLFLGISMSMLGVVAVVIGSAPWVAVARRARRAPTVPGLRVRARLIFSTINVFLREIGQVLTIALQLWVWLTPIVCVEEILPARVQGLIRHNPAYPFIDALRRMIVGGEWPSSVALACHALLGRCGARDQVPDPAPAPARDPRRAVSRGAVPLLPAWSLQDCDL